MFKRIFKRFIQMDQNEKLIKNLKIYEQKKREKQNEISISKRDKLNRQKIKEV